MNQLHIKRCYKVFGYINFFLSIVFVFYFTKIELSERILAAIIINIPYHMVYIFFSTISKNSTKMNNKFNKIVGDGMLKVFSIFGMMVSFILIYHTTSKAITLKEFYFFPFAICISLGIFLGAYSLWIDLNDE